MVTTLEETALALAAGGRKPSLFFLTDPQRTPDPLAVVARLPAGAVVVFRAFGASDAVETAQRLRDATRERSCLLLVGADAKLAEAVEADGVHLPERCLAEADALRQRHPAWVLTGAAHSAAGLAEADRAGLDAVLLSPVFESRSPSAGAPLGLDRFTALVAGARTPVIALGGVNAETAPQLLGSGAAGLAAVEGWLGASAEGP